MLVARRGRRTLAVSWLGLPLVLGLLLTLVELCPIPHGLRQLISPESTANIDLVIAGLAADPRAMVLPVLAVDPPEAAFAAVRIVGALAVFIVVADLTRDRRRRALAWKVLLVGGASLFAVALGHTLLQVPGAWGRFTRYPGFFYAPMVNPNQLARMFGAFGLACGARAFAVRDRRTAALFAATGLLCCASVAFTDSRGGLLALLAGVLVLGFVLVRRAPPERSARRWWLLSAVQVGAVAAAILATFAARTSILDALSAFGMETIDKSKLNIYGPALDVVRSHFLVGAGNGGFQDVFTTVVGDALPDANVVYTRAENIVIETLVDHGAAGGGLILASGLFAAIAMLAGLRHARQLLPLPALTVLVFGDLLDFVLESAAGIFLAAALLGLIAARLLERDALLVRIPRAWVRVGALGLTVLTMWTAAVAVARWRRSFDEALADAPNNSARTALIERAVAAHPHDGYYCYLRAVDARRRRAPHEALEWANRALVLWPTHGPSHLEAARVLAASGHPEQSMLEYRQAWLGKPPPRNLLKEIVWRTHDQALRRRAVPDTAEAITLLCKVLVNEHRLDEAQACMDEVAVRADADTAQRRAALELALKRGDETEARAQMAALEARPRMDGQAAALIATTRESFDGLVAARAEAAAADERVEAPAPLLEWRIHAALRAGDIEEAKRLLARLKTLPREERTPELLADLDAAMAHADHNDAAELEALERLLVRRPKDPEVQVRIRESRLRSARCCGLATPPRPRSVRSRRSAVWELAVKMGVLPPPKLTLPSGLRK